MGGEDDFNRYRFNRINRNNRRDGRLGRADRCARAVCPADPERSHHGFQREKRPAPAGDGAQYRDHPAADRLCADRGVQSLGSSALVRAGYQKGCAGCGTAFWLLKRGEGEKGRRGDTVTR
jgi:hypothetical protein